MATNAVGTYLYWTSSTESADQRIAEIRQIDLSNVRDFIDVTHLDSDNKYRQNISGLRDPGTISFTLAFTREQYDMMEEIFDADIKHSFRIELPDEDEDGDVSTIEFDAFMNELSVTVETD